MKTSLPERRIGGRLPFRQRISLVGSGCAKLFLLLWVVGMIWWQQVTYVPDLAPLNWTPPVPNARDDFLAASSLLPADSDDRLKSLDRVRSKSHGQYSVASPELRKLVGEARPVLKRLRVGLRRDFANPPVRAFQQSVFEYGEYYRLARLLDAESELALWKGRPGDALRSGLDAVKLGDMVQRNGPVPQGKVGIAVGEVGLHSIEIATEYADADSCARAAQELWELDAHAWTAADALMVERDSGMVILVEALRRSDLSLAFRNLPAALRIPPPPPVDRDTLFRLTVLPKRNLLERFRRNLEMEIARARWPYYVGGTLPAPPAEPLNIWLSPSTSDGPFTWARQQAVRRALLTRLAVRAYTLREGQSPPSLAALVPKYLPAVPQDPFAPTPLTYRVIQGKPCVYSLGPDGNDDQGRDLGSPATTDSDTDLGSTVYPIRPPGTLPVARFVPAVRPAKAG